MKTLADISGRRMARALGGKTPAEKFAAEHGKPPEKRKVLPELLPENFDHKVGLTKDDAGDPLLQRARRAFSFFSGRLQKWHDRAAVIESNQYETAQKRKMLVAKMVKEELYSGVEQPDAVYKDLRRQIENIDKGLDKAFRHRLQADDAREIRQHLKSMTKAERRQFLGKADEETLASVIAAKPFLSGLADAEHAAMRYQAERRLFPAEVRRREKLQKAAEQIQEAGDRFIREASTMIDPELSRFEETVAATRKAMLGTEA